MNVCMVINPQLPTGQAELRVGPSLKEWHKKIQILNQLYLSLDQPDAHSRDTYQLWDVPDVEGDLDEAPVASDADVLAAVVVGIPQTD